jgi:hypothetical protein
MTSTRPLAIIKSQQEIDNHHSMQKNAGMEQRIAYAMKQPKPGTLFEEAGRKLGISDATLCNWKKKYGSRLFLSVPPFDCGQP